MSGVSLVSQQPVRAGGAPAKTQGLFMAPYYSHRTFQDGQVLQSVNSEERMIANVVASLRQNPELAIFLTLALGFLLGRVRFGTFKLGNVVGTLLAGVLVGQLSIRVSPVVDVVFFDLFLFAVGYRVGPQFFRGLRRSAVPQLMLTVGFLCDKSPRTVAVAK